MPRLKFKNCDYDCDDMRDKRGTFRVYCRRVDKKCKISAAIEPWELRFDEFRNLTHFTTLGTGETKIGIVFSWELDKEKKYDLTTHNTSPVRAKKEAYIFEVAEAIKTGNPVSKEIIADYHNIKKEFIQKGTLYGLRGLV